jgi:hypothetical protein
MAAREDRERRFTRSLRAGTPIGRHLKQAPTVRAMAAEGGSSR